MTDGDAAPAAREPVTHRLSNGEEVTLPLHDEFYDQFTQRNHGVIADDDQALLRKSVILVAGCGSVGGAVVEPFVRFGAENLILVEPDEYDLHNLNRQNMRLQDIGRNKAEVLQERAGDINPYASIRVVADGITSDNVEDLVRQSDVIVDGVDVTTKAPLLMKYQLHQHAKRQQIPVISGYDIAGSQLLHIYDYRDPKTSVMNGRIRAREVPDMEPFEFLARVVPKQALPYEIIGELRRQVSGEREGFPQIVYTANLFGVLTLPAVVELLAGRPIKNRIILDIPTELRPAAERARILAARLQGLYHLNNEFRRSQSSKDSQPQQE